MVYSLCICPLSVLPVRRVTSLFTSVSHVRLTGGFFFAVLSADKRRFLFVGLSAAIFGATLKAQIKRLRFLFGTLRFTFYRRGLIIRLAHNYHVIQFYR